MPQKGKPFSGSLICEVTGRGQRTRKSSGGFFAFSSTEMATIADQFLADLRDDAPAPESNIDPNDMNVDSENSRIDPNSVHAIAHLLGSPPLTKILTEIPRYAGTTKRLVLLDEQNNRDPEYDLIVEANEMASKINYEIIAIHKFIRDIYSKKFPELGQQVLHPLDYARVVKKLGNDLSNTSKDLAEILPHSNIITISMTASSSTGTDLTQQELDRVFEAADVALQLDEAIQTILAYVESRMKLFAPNLSEIVGSVIAAKLIGVAGGLDKLAKMPASNLILLGRTKKTLDGFSTSTVVKHFGFIGDSDIIQQTPHNLETRAVRLIGNKCSLAARLDHTHDNHLNGELGVQLREEIEKKIEKWQEAPPARKEKPLPAPDDQPKKRRGGVRRKKEKELYAMTELRKRAMRMPFGQITEEYGNTLHSLGMIGQGVEGVGAKVRANVRDEKGMKMKKKKIKGNQTEMGFATSVYAMTPMQGLELAPGRAAQVQKHDGTATSYFDNATGFVIQQNK